MTDSRLPDDAPLDPRIRYTAFSWLVPLASLFVPGAMAAVIAAFVLPITGGFVIDNNALVATTDGARAWRVVTDVIVLAAIAFGATAATAAIIVRAQGRYVSPRGAWRIAARRPLAVTTLTVGLILCALAVTAARSAPAGADRGWLITLWIIAVTVAVPALLPLWVKLVARPVAGEREHVQLKVHPITQLLWLGLFISITAVTVPGLAAGPPSPWLHAVMWLAAIAAAVVFLLAALAAAARGCLAETRLELLSEQETPSRATPFVALAGAAAVALVPVVIVVNVAGITQFTRLQDPAGGKTDVLLATDNHMFAMHSDGDVSWCDALSCESPERVDAPASTATTPDTLIAGAWRPSGGNHVDGATSYSFLANSIGEASFETAIAQAREGGNTLEFSDPLVTLSVADGMRITNNGFVGTSATHDGSVAIVGTTDLYLPRGDAPRDIKSIPEQVLLAVAYCETAACETPATSTVMLENYYWSVYSSVAAALGPHGSVAVVTTPTSERDNLLLVTGSIGQDLDVSEVDLPGTDAPLWSSSIQMSSEGLPVIFAIADDGGPGLLIRCADLSCTHDERSEVQLPPDARTSCSTRATG